MDTYISKLRGLASAAAGAVQSKVGRDYDFTISTQAQRGTSGLWTLYDATRRSTGQAATVWVFDKQRFFDNRLNRELLNDDGEQARQRISTLLTTEAGHLARLRHPSILRLVEPVEETRTMLVFVTERVLMSLHDLLVSQNRGNGELDELEIQEGLMQVSKGLQFLHGDARRVHGNLGPSSVLVSSKGEWKIGGLGFSAPIGASSSGYEVGFHVPEFTRPALSYAAPECVVDGRVQPASDVFALGCLAAAAHSPDGQSPLSFQNDVGAYRRAVAGLAAAGGRLRELPEPLAQVVRRMVAADAQQRMTLAQFQGSAYFDSILASTLRYLASLIEQPDGQKIAFMRGLPQVLPRFPPRVLKRRVLPHLLAVISDHKLLRFTLPNVFFVVEQLTRDEVAALVLPELRPVFAMGDQQPQAVVVVLDNLQLLQGRLPNETFRTVVMPMVYAALLSPTPQVQDHALQQCAAVAELLGPAEAKDQLLPRIQQVYSKASILSLKVRALTSLHALLKVLDRQTIVAKVMPMLKRTKSRDPTVVMAMLAMYEEIGMQHLDRRGVATEILPVLWTQLVDERLRLRQFERFAEVVGRLQDRVLGEHRRHLEQIQRSDDQAEQFSNMPVGMGDSCANGEEAGNSDLFASIVGSTQPKQSSAVLQNPLAGLSSANAPSTNASAASPGWEWDAPAAVNSDQQLPKSSTRSVSRAPARSSSSRVSVEVDFMSTDGLSDTPDDFGAFTSFPPPPTTKSSAPQTTPKMSTLTPKATGSPLSLTKTASLKPATSRMRTASPVAQNKLGATRIGSEARTLFQFGATMTPPPQQQQKQQQKQPMNLASQKHVG
ncbi:Protein kinase domain-containing protein ppk32, partial [Coemansia sp. RSA 2618]